MSFLKHVGKQHRTMVFELMVEDVALVQEDQHHLSSSLDQSVILNSVYVQLSRGSKSFSCGPYNVTHAKCRKELNTKENELRTLQDYQPLLFKSTLYSRDLEPGNKKGLKSKKFSLNSKIPLIGRPGTSTATSNLDIGISLPIHFDPKIFKISILLDVQSLDSVEEKSVSASELVSAEINIADFAGRDGDVFHGEINLYPKSKVIKKKWMVSDSKFILKYSLTCGEPNSKYGAADFSSTTSSIHFSQNQPHESFSERLQRSVLEGVNSHTSTTASKSFESKILPETVRVKAVLSPEAISGVKKLRIHQKSLIDQTNQFGFDCLRRLEHMETRLSGIVSRLTKAFQLAVYKGLNNASFSLNEGIRDVEEGNRLKLNEITKVRKELDVVTKQIAQIQDVILVQRNFIRGKEDFVSKTQQKIRKAEASQQRKKHDFAVTEEDHAKARFRLAKNHLALVEFERNANRVKYLQKGISLVKITSSSDTYNFKSFMIRASISKAMLMLSPLRSSSSKTAGSTLLGHVSINLSDIACIRLWNNAVIDAKSGKRKTVMPGKTDFSDNVDTIWPWERFFLILKNGEYYNFAADSQNDLENFILGLQYLLLLDSPKQDLLDLSSHRWTRTKISWYRAFTKTLILNKAANQS